MPEIKRLISYVSSHASDCRYCQAHMILASERFGASEEWLEGVWDPDASPHFTEAERAALACARAATAQPTAVSAEIAERLRRHWSDEDIVEITVVVALFGYLNRWNDSMGSVPEGLTLRRRRGAPARIGLERRQARLRWVEPRAPAR